MTKKNKVVAILCVIALAIVLTGSTYCYYLYDNSKQLVNISQVPILPEDFVKERIQELEALKDTGENKEVSRGGVQREKYLGTFKISAYCPGSCCNGSNFNKTATGKKMMPYKTVAVDPKVIPLNSKLKIECNGKVYYVIANDTGSAIKNNKIDMNMDTHQNALNWGVQYGNVWIIG